VAVREIQGSKEGAFELVQVSNQSVLIKFVGKPDISVPRKLIQTIAAALTQTAEAQAARASTSLTRLVLWLSIFDHLYLSPKMWRSLRPPQ
jgi:hypothetical protein